ncbi:MAG TPA: dienelactone hydrolase family protein [Candidatus Acidoferrum sp.]|nr:dienelactone hydrolase family protein [Candidatus Acidoferrum sp.]
MKRGLFVIASLIVTLALRAEVKFETIEYKAGGTTCEGMLVYDDAISAKRPGVLIAHQWKGLTDYEKKRAEMLVKLGYVTLCADVYGKGVRADNPKDASALAAKYKADRPLLRERINAALTTLRASPRVNTSQVGAIGYCFGGTTVLELARSSAKINGVVSFHGGLGSPTPADAKNIQSRVLALHGADDPFVPQAEVEGFQKEMRDAKVDWQLVAYGNAVHSFSDWNAGSDNSKGSAYNKLADERSWEAMKTFFAEILK